MLDRVEITAVGSIAVIKLTGRLTLGEAVRQMEHVTEAWNRAVLDVSELTAVDSTGVSALVDACVKAENRGGKFALAGASRRLTMTWKICMLDRVIPLYDSVSLALAAVREAGG